MIVTTLLSIGLTALLAACAEIVYFWFKSKKMHASIIERVTHG